MKQPMITLVAAMNQERIIGVNNQLPWHIPEDLQYFTQVTWGKPIIMGRKTFESIGRVLPGRENIVITRDPNWQHAPVKVYPSLIEAIKDNQDSAELCIIGGGEIFTQALPMADKLLLTLVEVEVPNATPNTTAFFPQVNWQQWQLVKQTQITTKDNICCCFKEFIRQEV